MLAAKNDIEIPKLVFKTGPRPAVQEPAGHDVRVGSSCTTKGNQGKSPWSLTSDARQFRDNSPPFARGLLVLLVYSNGHQQTRTQQIQEVRDQDR